MSGSAGEGSAATWRPGAGSAGTGWPGAGSAGTGWLGAGWTEGRSTSRLPGVTGKLLGDSPGGPRPTADAHSPGTRVTGALARDLERLDPRRPGREMCEEAPRWAS